MNTRERDVEQYLVREMRTLGLECIKFIPDGMTGMPDRMVLLPDGRVMWIELKTEGGRVAEIQKYRHEELRKIGHDVRVVWNKEQVNEIVDEIKKDTGSN